MELALLAFCALLPTYLLRFQIPILGTGLTIPATVLEILFWLLFGAWLITHKDKANAKKALNKWKYPLILLITASIISIANSPDLRAALGLWRAYILEPILFFFIYTSVITTGEGRQKTVRALAVATIIIGLSAVIQKITGYGIPNPIWAAAATRRVTSFYGFPNAIALFIAPLIPLFAHQLITTWREKKISCTLILALATILGATAIIFAKSAGGMIGMTIGALIVAIADKKIRPFAVAAALAIPILFATIPAARNYLQQTVTGQNDSSSVRKIIWDETITMLRNRPVFGGGLSGYPQTIAPYHKATYIEVFQYPHNEILNIWSELGLLGLVAFAWLAFLYFWKNRSIGLVAAGVVILIHGLVDVPYFKNDLAMLTWILLAMVESLRQERLRMTKKR